MLQGRAGDPASRFVVYDTRGDVEDCGLFFLGLEDDYPERMAPPAAAPDQLGQPIGYIAHFEIEQTCPAADAP